MKHVAVIVSPRIRAWRAPVETGTPTVESVFSAPRRRAQSVTRKRFTRGARTWTVLIVRLRRVDFRRAIRRASPPQPRSHSAA